MATTDKRKGQIKEAARSLFYQRGFTSVTMNDIARSLGMSKKTLYQFYSSKKELLEAILSDFESIVSGRIEEILADESLPFTEKLKSFLSYLGQAMNHISNVLVHDIKVHLPAMWERLEDYKRTAAFDRFDRLIAEGVRQGYVRKDIERPVVIALYSCAIEYLLDPAFLKQLPAPIRDAFPDRAGAIFDQIIRVIFQGILVEEARKELSSAPSKPADRYQSSLKDSA
ncbi:TetR/AcrR family transcriptional regulator [Roseivirga sp. BDSF3-8]|uniref:TetR/AcrR family transcriptional regulator n=1 Tax=Roseivirga sp. BDSF3-8 TaxID=3241598 RepID=UPI003532681E